MSHVFQIGLEGQAAVNFQSLFDANSLSDSGTIIFEDEGDIFICGRCKRQFGSLSIFMLHKRGHMEEEVHSRQFDNNVIMSSLPSFSHQSQNEEEHQGSIGGHIQSIVLTDDKMSLTIPVENSQLGQLMSNPQTVLHIPEAELAALIAGEGRYHISAFTDPSNSMNSQGYFLTASKEPQSERNHLGYDVNDGHVMENPNYNFQLKRESSEGEAVSRISKAPPPIMMEETGVPRIGNKGKVENTRQGPNKQKVSKPTTISTLNDNIKRNNSAEKKNNSSTTIKNQKPIVTGQRTCPYCGKMFTKLFNLHQHIRSHTGEKPFHCLVCGRGFTQKSNVKKHMQTHKVWPKIKCTLPKEQISMQMKVGEPLPVVVGDNGGELPQAAENVEYIVNNVYVCQYCDHITHNYHKLKTHLSQTHKNEKLFKCVAPECVATFSEVDSLISHMKCHEDQMEYQCQNCTLKFLSLFDLGTHQFSHTHKILPNKAPTATPPKQFRCSQCNSKYASSEALNHHLLTSSHNYPCSQCTLTFVCERYLRRHLRIHGTVEPFKCDQCSKMFKTENYLKSHLVIHSNSKPFSCDTCKLSFNRRDKLTRHQLKHDSRKKYKCPYKNSGCEREFYRKDKLKDHLLSHSRKVNGMNNFTLPARRKQQASATTLLEHPEMFSSTTCPTCQKIFKTKHHLKIHACKKALTEIMDTDLNNSIVIHEENISSSAVSHQNHAQEQQDLAVDDNLLDGEALSKVVVLYNDCEIEDSINSNEEKLCGPTGIMLGSFTHAEDPEAVIFTRYATEISDDKEGCLVEPSDNDGGIEQIETLTFEPGQIEQLIVAD